MGKNNNKSADKQKNVPSELPSQDSVTKKKWPLTTFFAVLGIVVIVLVVWGIVRREGEPFPGDTTGTASQSVAGVDDDASQGPFSRDLSLDDVEADPQVALLQVFLAGQKLFNEDPLGIYTQATEDSVRKFQKMMYIEETGIVDAPTRELLNEFFFATPGYFADNRSFEHVGIGQCKGFAITSPFPGEQVSFPLTISGTLHPYKNTGVWNVENNVAGIVMVQDMKGNVLSDKVSMVLEGAFTKGKTKNFTVDVALSKRSPKGYVDLYFQDADETHECYLTVEV